MAKLNPKKRIPLTSKIEKGIEKKDFSFKNATDFIAYKVSTEKLIPLFYNDMGDELDSNNPRLHSGYHFLGLNFEFKKNSSDNSIEDLEISQLLLKYDKPTDEFSLIKNAVDSSLLNKLTDDHCRKVEKITTLTVGSRFDVSENTISENYGLLEFYDPNTELIYFSVDQLQFICEGFDYVVISGCKINFGMKLSHRENDELTNFDDGGYFTLKIEGINPKPSTVVVSSTQTSNTTDQSTDGTDTIVGQPCPPKWYTFTIIANQLYTVVPDIDMTVMRNVWYTTVDQSPGHK